jgi:tetratricopeptide (TPR) repeat protein
MKKSLALLFLAMLAVACGGQRHIKQQLDRADALMIDHPDSALEILNSMDRRALATPEKKARHALLLSQALDKNYIDVDNDSLVDQAVRYYSRRGNDIERAKAHYYYAVVKGNAAESGTAIKALLMAREHVVKTDDDRMKALIYTYLGNLYYEQFCFSDAATAYSEAVDAFKNTGQTFYLLYAMRRKGVSLSLIDKKPEALACLSEAKEIAIQANDVSSLLDIMASYFLIKQLCYLINKSYSIFIGNTQKTLYL